MSVLTIKILVWDHMRCPHSIIGRDSVIAEVTFIHFFVVLAGDLAPVLNIGCLQGKS